MSVTKTTKGIATFLLAAGFSPTAANAAEPLATDSANEDNPQMSNPKLPLESSAEFGPGDTPELGEGGGVRGVNPADNITQLELPPGIRFIFF